MHFVGPLYHFFLRSLALFLVLCLLCLNTPPPASAQVHPGVQPNKKVVKPVPKKKKPQPRPRVRPSPRPVPSPTPPEIVPSPSPSPAVELTPDTRAVIAIAEILNLTKDENLTVTVADQLANALLNIPDFREKFRWVERSQVKSIMAELAFQGQTGLTDPRTTKRLGQILNASQLLVGSIRQESDGRLTLNMSLLDTETAERKQGVTVANIPLPDLNEGIECLALNIASKLNVKVTKERLAELNNKFKLAAGGNFLLWGILGGVALIGGILLLSGGKTTPTSTPPAPSLKVTW